MRDTIVLAGGSSVAEYRLRDIERRGFLIAVNDSSLYTKCDVAFTMDRKWIEARQLLLKTLSPPSIWYRKGTPKNFLPPLDWKAFVHDAGYPTLMTKQEGKLNGSNSGTCALNLAFQRAVNLRLQSIASRVFMFGFDMQRGPEGQKHWYPDYPWADETHNGTKPGTFMDWANEFEDIYRQFKTEQLEVYNVSHRSLVGAMPKISFGEFLRITQ